MPRHLTSADLLSDPLPLRVMRMHQGAHPLHGHDFTELVVVLRGRALHETGDDVQPIVAGDVLLLHAAQRHGYRETDQLEIANVLVHLDALGMPLQWLRDLPGYHALLALPQHLGVADAAPRLRLKQSELAQADALLQALDTELRRREAGYGFAAIARFMHLLTLLVRAYAPASDRPGRSLGGLGAAFARIERDYREPLRLADLAELAGMSQSGFQRAFRRITGRSPIAYVLQLRLQRAAELLCSTEHRITDIALACGFSDSNYFARQFRVAMGMSARDYRKRQRSAG